jgi:SAM-dependent methyltransferase
LLSRSSAVRLLEVGCGGSVFLPYFRSEYGFEITGLDYSEIGCEKSRAIQNAANIPADIHQGDMFEPPGGLPGAFDFVCSFGLVEHFRPTETAISALAQFCRPGGYLLTTVPNLCGILGDIQSKMNREIYDQHVPLSLEELGNAHLRAGLQVIECAPIGTLNMMVLNFSGPKSWIPEVIGLPLAAFVSRVAWALHRGGLPERPSLRLSPYLGCLSRVPADGIESGRA